MKTCACVLKPSFLPELLSHPLTLCPFPLLTEVFTLITLMENWLCLIHYIYKPVFGVVYVEQAESPFIYIWFFNDFFVS